MFDDTIEHEALNPSDELRVVFIFDVWHPDLEPIERQAIAAAIEADDAAAGGAVTCSGSRATVDAERAGRTSRARRWLNGEEEARARQLAPAAESATQRLACGNVPGCCSASLDRARRRARALSRAAARLAPNDAGIAHGLARVALEAGLDAVALFERALAARAVERGGAARAMSPQSSRPGADEEAEAKLEHVARAVAAMDRRPCAACPAALDARQARRGDSLARAGPRGSTKRGTPVGGVLNLDAAARATSRRWTRSSRAREAAGRAEIARSCRSKPSQRPSRCETDRADALFDAHGADLRELDGVWHVRHLLRAGAGRRRDRPHRPRDRGRSMPPQFWPYASTRLAARPAIRARSGSKRDGKLVPVFDLADQLPPLDRWPTSCGRFMSRRGEYLDQSVRGGTQTDGPLLSRIEPEIQALRAAIVERGRGYRRATAAARSQAIRCCANGATAAFAFPGSWSVRLRGARLSCQPCPSAGLDQLGLYVALPERAADEPRGAGWLKLGEPTPTLGLAICPPRNDRAQARSASAVPVVDVARHGALRRRRAADRRVRRQTADLSSAVRQIFTLDVWLNLRASVHCDDMELDVGASGQRRNHDEILLSISLWPLLVVLGCCAASRQERPRPVAGAGQAGPGPERDRLPEAAEASSAAACVKQRMRACMPTGRTAGCRSADATQVGEDCRQARRCRREPSR